MRDEPSDATGQTCLLAGATVVTYELPRRAFGPPSPVRGDAVGRLDRIQYDANAPSRITTN